MANGDATDGNRRGLLRRTVLRAVGVGGTVASIAGIGAGANGESGTSESSAPSRRITAELRTRIGRARRRLDGRQPPAHGSNDRVSSTAVVSKFGKSLPHDDDTGLPTADGYASLVDVCEGGGGFERIRQQSLALNEDDGIPEEIDISELVDDELGLSPRPLVQPESAWSYLSEGRSTAQYRIATPPAFDSAEAAAEMVELYWRALTRDIPFHEYDVHGRELIREAVRELEDVDGYRGPGGEADPTSDELGGDNVFRGIVPGSQTGPHVSQFLLKDRRLGGGVEHQRLEPQTDGSTPRDYLTTVEDWLKIQKGIAPSTDRSLPGNEYADTRRYIVTGRDLCERVHDDPPFRQIQKAAQVLVYTMQAPLDEGIPYVLKPFRTQDRLDSLRTPENETPNSRTRESRRDVDRFLSQATLPFNDFGPLYIEKKAVEATEHAQKAAWHKKWNVHRRLRPEEYGGRIEAAKSAELDAAEPYPIPEALRTSEAIEHTTERFDSYLLPQAYAEGSPTHPSYPAGHSVVAGAGVTVLKALFDGDHTFAADEKVVPTVDGSELVSAEAAADSNEIVRNHNLFSELTVRGELNKLATNMALGRNWAGIHYRSDGIEGLRLGESVAIDFLEDQLSLPAVDGVRLSLTTFDGEPVTIAPTV
jgi:hypothetical protein